MTAMDSFTSKTPLMELHPDEVIVRRDDRHLTNPLGEETVLLDLQTGDYLGLDPVASTIWAQLKTPQTLVSILARLQEEYEVGEEECRRDTLEFLRRIDSLGLIQRLT